MASASNDGVRVWDVTTGQEIHFLNGHSGPVNDVAFHPDGTLLISAGNDGSARVWDIETGQELLMIGSDPNKEPGSWESFQSVVFSSDGSKLVTGSSDNMVRIWDADTGEELHMLEGHTGTVTNAIFTPDNRFVISGGTDVSVRVWDVETGQQVMTIPAVSAASGIGSERLNGLDISPDGRYLATTDPDTTVKIWSLDLEAMEAELIATTSSLGDTPRNVQFSPDGQILATGTSGSVPIRLWDVSNLDAMTENNSLTDILSLGDSIWAMTFNEDGSELITGSQNGLLHVFLLNTDDLLALAHARLTRTFTFAECLQYRIDPCPTNP